MWDAADWLEPVLGEIRDRLADGETVDALVAEFEGDGTSEDTPIVNGLRDYLERLQRDALA